MEKKISIMLEQKNKQCRDVTYTSSDLIKQITQQLNSPLKPHPYIRAMAFNGELAVYEFRSQKTNFYFTLKIHFK